MPKLPPEWAAHLEAGVSHRVGSSHPDGRPEISRALAAWALPDGPVEVVLNRDAGFELLAAVQASRRIAYVASQPDSNRTLHVKGVDAQTVPPTEAHMRLMARCAQRFVDRVERFGHQPQVILDAWFRVGIDQVAVLRFTPMGAWDQSPGPGAGQVIDLLP
ncbi:MAG: hypothetical protein ACKVQR_07725 [Aquabacterium sp.]